MEKELQEMLGDYVRNLELDHPYTINCTREQDEKIWDDKLDIAISNMDEFWLRCPKITAYIKDHLKEELEGFRND